MKTIVGILADDLPVVCSKLNLTDDSVKNADRIELLGMVRLKELVIGHWDTVSIEDLDMIQTTAIEHSRNTLERLVWWYANESHPPVDVICNMIRACSNLTSLRTTTGMYERSRMTSRQAIQILDTINNERRLVTLLRIRCLWSSDLIVPYLRVCLGDTPMSEVLAPASSNVDSLLAAEMGRLADDLPRKGTVDPIDVLNTASDSTVVVMTVRSSPHYDPATHSFFNRVGGSKIEIGKETSSRMLDLTFKPVEMSWEYLLQRYSHLL